jgi:hypothetical protein
LYAWERFANVIQIVGLLMNAVVQENVSNVLMPDVVIIMSVHQESTVACKTYIFGYPM